VSHLDCRTLGRGGGSGTSTPRPPSPTTPQHPVAVFLAEVGDVLTAGFKDPRAEEAHHCEVAGVGRLTGGDQHGLELQMRQPQHR